MNPVLKKTLFLSVISLITSCSSLTAGNLFSHYSLQNQVLYQSVKAGHYQQAIENLPNSVGGDILDNMEKGRVAFLDQQYPESKQYLEESERAVQKQQDQALISLSESATDIGSLAVNDNLTAYSPGDYELGFLHLYLGLNYLQENSLEGALVEVRKANLVQEQARKSREKTLKQAEAALRKQGVSSNLGAVLSHYPDAGQSLQAVQNGYLLYLSALLYEAADELNNAYVDYRRALAVAPDNKQVIQGTFRVAEKLSMSEDLKQLRKTYGNNPASSRGHGQIIVIEEQGIVGARHGWTLSLPFYSYQGTAVHSLALPYYPPGNEEHFPVIRLNDKTLTKSILTDVNLMARQDLTERIPAMVSRLVLRVIAKEQLRRSATNGDDAGNLLFNVWNIITEQPDTRSWQTLPSKVYSYSSDVAPGEYKLDFERSQDGEEGYTIKVKSGETVLVWLSRQGENGTVWHKPLGGL
ncbi:hypothetical protein DI392_01395 [Vibrio albus]|uniref:Lipoprotein n=1 Tax=Vibrio albus TaxID=2200953 RepID=A0A2U3BDU4_9VIBR|nr:hypothetical protein [Vibrio albus]PWI34961.1 hypothetical protein DI392_01395 [Vibrio albus]